MALYVGSVVMSVSDLERAKAFWMAALGYVVRESKKDFVVLIDPNRRWSNISLQSRPGLVHRGSRVHLDLYSDDQMAEVQRLESLGAVQLDWDYPPDADYVVMSDPEGNEFCIIDSRYSQD